MEKCPSDHGPVSVSSVEGHVDERNSSPSCPVDHKNIDAADVRAFGNLAERQEAEKSPSKSCPVQSKNENKGLFDAHGQRINPDNMMPSVPNKLPAPSQKSRLSAYREKSTVPF